VKICYATDWLPGYHKSWGGAEQACYRLAQLLIKQGHEVSVLATRPLKNPEEGFRFRRVRTIEDYLPPGATPILRQIKAALFPYDPVAAIASYRVLKRIRPDWLHVHNVYSMSLALVLNARRLGIPVVLSVYDYWFLCPLGFLWKVKDYTSYEGEACTDYHGRHCYTCLKKSRKIRLWQKPFIYTALLFRRRLLDFFIKRIDRFVILSQANARVLEEYGIDKSRIQAVHIPLGENMTSFETEPDKGYILYVGWLHPRKGPHVAVEAMPRIMEKVPDAKLYLVGEPANTAYLERITNFIKKNHLEENVRLMGRKPHSEVRELMRDAAVLVIPEQWETIAPNALTEGLVYGLRFFSEETVGRQLAELYQSWRKR
jgi:glycosyltransferase involved in cell wall biosynthesis